MQKLEKQQHHDQHRESFTSNCLNQKRSFTLVRKSPFSACNAEIEPRISESCVVSWMWPMSISCRIPPMRRAHLGHFLFPYSSGRLCAVLTSALLRIHLSPMQDFHQFISICEKLEKRSLPAPSASTRLGGESPTRLSPRVSHLALRRFWGMQLL